jgi:hypothetical protein
VALGPVPPDGAWSCRVQTRNVGTEREYGCRRRPDFVRSDRGRGGGLASPSPDGGRDEFRDVARSVWLGDLAGGALSRLTIDLSQTCDAPGMDLRSGRGLP